MMKILVLSDLHLEFSDMQKPTAEADVVLLAGDIWQGDRGIYWARETWPETEVIYVSGNHEFYGHERIEVLSMLRDAAHKTGVHFLENDQVIIDGIRFLGCTLWTDFKLFGENLKHDCMVEGESCLNDFRLINEGSGHFSTQDSIRLHEESVAWLSKSLNEPFIGKTVVVSHHLPSADSVVHRYKKDLLSACFASKLDYLMGKSALWIHGHTHDSLDYQANTTRVICNPRGYCRFEGGEENSDFNPNFVAEI